MDKNLKEGAEHSCFLQCSKAGELQEPQDQQYNSVHAKSCRQSISYSIVSASKYCYRCKINCVFNNVINIYFPNKTLKDLIVPCLS